MVLGAVPEISAGISREAEAIGSVDCTEAMSSNA